MEAQFKAALNLWCSKKRINPSYNVELVSSDNNFKCEITVNTISYTGVGNGANKKAASNNAAFNFLKYLTENKYITEADMSLSCFESLAVSDKFFPNLSNISKQTKPPSVSTPASNNKNTPSTVQSNRKAKNNKSTTKFWREPPYFNGQNHFQNHCGPPQPPPPNSYYDYPALGPGGPPPSSGPYDRPFGPGPGPYEGQFGPGPYDGSFEPPFGGPFGPGPFHGSFNGPYNGPGPYGPGPYDGPAGPGPGPMPSKPNFDRFHYRNPNLADNKTNDKNGSNGDSSNSNSGSNGGKLVSARNDNDNSNSEAVENICSMLKKRKLESKQLSFGNFTPDNSKQQLNIFMQTQRIKADYEIESFGPPHRKTFISTLKFIHPRLQREFFAKEKGNSKQDASRNCALSMLRILFDDGMISQFEPDAPSKRQLLKMSSLFLVEVNTALKEEMISAFNMVQSYNQYINSLKNPSSQPVYAPGSVNYFSPMSAAVGMIHDTPMNSANTYLYWCAPMENFNPWTGTKPDDPYSGRSTEDVNITLQQEFGVMVKTPKFQANVATRMKLPIWPLKDQIISLINNNPVTIIKGSTGCGKTTQVPQFILDSYLKAGNGANCNIVVTQPRRISAISISERIAVERLEEISNGKASVGYSVRFDHVYPRPYGSILFCTTGHLLRRIQGGLKGISHLIIDEVHERDINTDLLLVIVRDLINLGFDLRVIIMSATIDVSHFQKYFRSCPVVEIAGSLFPVHRYFLEDCIENMKYKPNPGRLTYMEEDIETDNIEDRLADFNVNSSYSRQTIELLRTLKEGVICFELIVSLLEYIDELYETGAVLIFLPGWNAIFSLLNFLKKHRLFGDENRFMLLPLHSQLSHKENNRIFQKSSQRKIILSTNIAETSITIDDVVFVVDSCLIKRKIYDPRTNITSYVTDWVSKSNVQQRQGRAGRVRSGYYFALCTRVRYNSFEQFKTPEILTSSLVETSLLIKYLGFGSVSEFLNKSIDAPKQSAIEDALKTLQDINAFDQYDELTPLGVILSKLPIDPRIGRMVIVAILLGVGSPSITIAAASAMNFEIFETFDLSALLRSLSNLDEDRFSDHLIFLKVYNMYERIENVKSNNHCLNLNALSVVRNARKQLVEILTKTGFNAEIFDTKYIFTSAEFDTIAGLLITAFYPNVCIHKEARRILTNEERIGLIHKTSVLYSYFVDGLKPIKTLKLKSPLFVYSEKTANKNLISSKQMSMVTFMQLLLFGIKKFEFPPNNENQEITDSVVLDGWLEIQIDPQVFDCCWVIKTELENILSRICTKPADLNSLTAVENTILNSVKTMCSFDSVTVNIIVKKTKEPEIDSATG